MKKYILSFLILFSISQSLLAFDWPQDDITADSFNSFFGQNRGGEISSSVVFSTPSIVKAADDGELLVIISEQDDDTDFFPSTLGNALVLSHKDNILSVYGNLEPEITSNIEKTNQISMKKGEYIAETGTSGWQERVSGLEFQIVDTENASSINPKVLMSRTETEIPLTITNVTLENKSGNTIDLNISKTIPSGLYKIYYKRNDVACPYKSSILLNGVIVDKLSYDIIIQENEKTCILGKKKYIQESIYPDGTRHLLGEAMFTPGKTTLTVEVENILGETNVKNYNLSIK